VKGAAAGASLMLKTRDDVAKIRAALGTQLGASPQKITEAQLRKVRKSPKLLIRLRDIMTQLVKRAPHLIPQQLRGIIEAKRSQSLHNESCDRSALMMPRNCCGIKSGAPFTNCVIFSIYFGIQY
jgi:hypothetical protein